MTQNEINEKIRHDIAEDINKIQLDLIPIFRIGFSDECSKIMELLKTISFKAYEKFPHESEGGSWGEV